MIRKLLTPVLLVAIVGMASSGAMPARAADRAPTQSYFNYFNIYYEGDYLDALRAFQSECRGSIKTAQSRWIDSICYETACGECYYQMGVLDRALQHYTNALELFNRFPNWMTKVQFAATITAAQAAARKNVPWGVTTRQSRLGRYPDSVNIAQSQTSIIGSGKKTGLYQQANLFPINPQEIIRCTTLALRRRTELLGPVCKQDPLTNQVVAAMNGSIGSPNHWSNAWTDLERGLALAADGKDGQAVGYLNRSIVAAGEFDHPMTCIALFELGRLALKQNQYPAAAKFFNEATFAAVNYGDYGILEEAFRYGMITHLMSNRKGFFAPLEPAMQWAKVKGLRQLRASLAISAAENYAALGQTRQAAAMLDDARASIGRRKMGSGIIGARLSYVSALVAFQQKRVAEGNAALAASMGYMQHGSFWLFHINMVDRLYMGGGITARSAINLFDEVLRDPRPADWAFQPMESFATLVTPQPGAMEHWFEAALDRRDVKEVASAVEIAERTRRRRFFSSLEFGGRLESLRWILEAPSDRLSKDAQLQRQDILARFPAYAQLSKQSQAIREALGKLPLKVETPAAAKEQTRQLNELATLGAEQEAILRELALRREPADMVFPPLRSLTDVQKSLPDKHAALVFFATSKNMYGFLLNNERCTHWRVGSTAALLRQMQSLLRDIGQYGSNYELPVKDLGDEKWRLLARQVLDTLLKGSPADFSQSFDELAIVPDGALWYLPFEALQVTVDKKSESLIARFRIRYAPTLSLCVPEGPGRNAAGVTAVVVGRLYPRDDTAVAQAAFDEMLKVVPGAVAIPTPPPAPTSIYGTLFRQLVVLDDIASSEENPYGWSVAPVDRGKAGSALGDWFSLPWGGPDVVVLPGFHTTAEDSLKRLHRGPPGNDVFLSVCGLMANGARTVLLSRWRVGGQSSFDLVREFVQELPNTSAADAWQRAVLLAIDSRVNLEAEPRVKRTVTDETPKAANPFFWAGYMLIDAGGSPEKSEPKPQGPVLKLKKVGKEAEKKKP